MNLAIVIGVSKYTTQKQLPACKNDALIIKELLNESKKYDDMLYIAEETRAQNIKTQIIDFVNNYKDKDDLEEIFFYFSGHGWFDKKEFRYICSDFEAQNINRTSLKNSELDDIIKVLGAKLAIKVVDACNSGTRYIKDNIDEEAVKNNMKKVYNNCYFMFSCQQEQFSRANDRISYFTDSFVKSIINFNGDNIRYRDIMDYVSDEFNGKDIEQQPFYVTQSSNMEYFINTSEELKEIINKNLNELLSMPAENNYKEDKNIYDILKENAKKYCNNFDEFIESFQLIEEEFKKFELDDKLKGIYEIEITAYSRKYSSLPSIEKVAQSISDNSNELFVKVDYKKEKIEKLFKMPFENDEYRNIPISYEITVENLNYNCINIEVISSLPNVKKVKCILIFAFSRKDIRLYYFYELYNEKDWNNYYIKNNVKWNSVECEIKNKDMLISSINDIKSELNNYLLEYVEKVIDNIK
ncbi:caspase family protein [Clostridium saccharoperbutylacetonicum]